MKKIILKCIAVVLFVINAFVLVESAINLGAVIDSLIVGDFELFKMSIILLTVYSVLSFIFPIIGYQIVYYVSFEEMNRLKAAKFSSDVMADTKETDLSEYSQNVDLIYSGILMNKWNFLNIASVFVFTAIRISSLSIILFLIAFMTSALPLLIPFVLQNSLKEKSSQFLEGSKEYVSFVKDKLGGRGELIRYKGVKWAVNKHDALSRNQEVKRKQFKFSNMMGKTASEGVSGIAQVIILFVGGIFAFRRVIQIGETVTLLQLMNYLAGPVVTMVTLINERNSSLPAYEKFKKADQAQGQDIARGSGKPQDDRIVLRDVDLSYDSKKIFTGLNLCFENHKSYLITGVSGCGKSTLLKLIAGEMKPDKGEISVFGHKMEDAGANELFGLVSYVSQDTYIFEDSVQENIAFDNADDVMGIDNLIDFMQLELGTDEIISHSREISGGEKKRIGLARAFIQPKEIFLLDEITNGLNHELAMRITKKILSMDKMVLFVSHDESKEFRELFDFVIELE